MTFQYPFLIIGTGIAGLALAYRFGQLKIPYLLLERDSSLSFRSQGYALTIQDNGQQVLRDLGLYDEFVAASVPIKEGYRTFKKDGTLVRFKPNGRNRVLPRFDLRRFFYDRIDQSKIMWNTRLQVLCDSGEYMRVVLTTGNDNTFGLNVAAIIAADGLRSSIRDKIVEDSIKYMGVISIYGMTSVRVEGEFQTAGDQWRFFSKPFNSELQMWQLNFPWPEEKPLPSNEEAKDLILSQIGSWRDPIPQMIQTTSAESMRVSLLYDRDPLQEPLPNCYKLTLIGDALHPLAPNKGMGANLALEDIWSLSNKLVSFPDIPSAFRAFEKEMIARSTPLVLQCRALVNQYSS